MIKHEIQMKALYIPVVFICDKCKVEIPKTDQLEWQETHTIEFTAGYSSVFGDCNKVTCHLCQKCLYSFIGSICTIKESSVEDWGGIKI